MALISSVLGPPIKPHYRNTWWSSLHSSCRKIMRLKINFFRKLRIKMKLQSRPNFIEPYNNTTELLCHFQISDIEFISDGIFIRKGYEKCVPILSFHIVPADPLLWYIMQHIVNISCIMNIILCINTCRARLHGELISKRFPSALHYKFNQN